MNNDTPMQQPGVENTQYETNPTQESYALPTLAGPSINQSPSNDKQNQPNPQKISRRQSEISTTSTRYTQGYNNPRTQGSDTPGPPQSARQGNGSSQPKILTEREIIPSSRRRDSEVPTDEQSESGTTPSEDAINITPLDQPPRNPSRKIRPPIAQPPIVQPDQDEDEASWWNPKKWIKWIKPHWILILALTYLCLLAAFITFIILYTKEKKNTPNTTDILVVTLSAVSAVLPHADSAIGAANVIFGVDAQTKDASKIVIAFESNNRLCVRSNSNETWSENVQCLEGTNMKVGSPIAVLDWLGGPSIYYLDKNNFLSGVDYIPETEGWKLSSLASQKMQANSQSQLAAVTWLNGSSAWVYYQDTNNQLREFGIYDPRDVTWNQGAYGPIELFLPGSGIGAARYVIDGNECLEVYYQTSNNAIHGRLYAMNIWTSIVYSVQSTTTSLSGNAGLTATTVIESSGNTIILVAYISNDGFLTVQSRNTLNVTDYGAFSTPMNIKQGDGSMMTGIAATGNGSPDIYFEDGQDIILLSAPSVSDAASSWSSLNLST